MIKKIQEISDKLNECVSSTPERCKECKHYRNGNYIACQDLLIQEMAKACREVERMIRDDSKDM